ncbi:MAG: EnvZ/OmpR regulon moderator MzrA [Serratia symbiotica]|nr:EnvZ/OmpR regulon moderator MzrA [Serratia symbiotica]
MERTEVELHIHASRQSMLLPNGFCLYQRLDEHGIHIKSITPKGASLLIRLDPPEQQLPAREVLQNSLTSGYSIVLNLPLTPSHWAGEFVGFPLNQGSNPA